MDSGTIRTIQAELKQMEEDNLFALAQKQKRRWCTIEGREWPGVP